MSLLGRWYRVGDGVHYWRNGFLRSGCGLIGPPDGGTAVASGSDCPACVDRHAVDLRYNGLSLEEGMVGHAVLADSLLDVMEIAIPFTRTMKAWMLDHGLKVRQRNGVYQGSFVLGGESRDLVLEPGSYLVSNPHGDIFSVPATYFKSHYRCVNPESLVP